ncbi:MAG: hypothetical protein JWM91_250 [Rhodospirillales bacterium]|nr:hypothetical protein [Rhodospirillales bacterium]
MSASSRKIITALCVVGLTTAATMAIAEQVAPPAATEKHGGRDREHHHMMPGQMIEARLAYIKTALQITPAQMTQWNAVADIMRKHAKTRDEKFAAMHAKMQDMKDDERQRPDPITMLEHRQKMLTDASANMAEMIAVLKPLYAALSDSQKEIAAEVLEHGRGGMGHGGWGRGEER